MTDKPSYLPLLNRIANAETEAEGYLGAWAATTPRADVRQILAAVALREGEHGKAFAKRLCELGYEVEPMAEIRAKAAERAQVTASTNLSDREKFEKLGFGQPSDPSQPDQFAAMFADRNIDIQTGELLGRYISEERDSTRMFEDCYRQLCAEENGAPASAAGAGTDRLARIESLLEQLVDRLPAAQPAASTGGKRRSK
jgi:rubrerythrin